MKKQIKLFEKQTGVKLSIVDGKLHYGGYLNLGGTGITSLPDNLTVGGYLYLGGTGITSLPDNLTVGGYLYLGGTGITSLPDNLTVGGSLYLGGTGITDESKVNRNIDLLQWKNGKYIKVDDIFTEVIKKRGNVYKVKKLNTEKTFYVVTDGAGKYAHGYTVREAKDDLMYKILNRNKSDYEGLAIKSEITHSDAIMCYRVITGACSFGTKDFVNNRLNQKPKYTIAEIIKLTKGEYNNNVFAKFFSK